jgi:hypothetical protein
LCGHKHKFGLNCLVKPDCQSHILGIQIRGVLSNCLAFEASDLQLQFESGLMKQDEGTECYITTPFTNVANDPNQRNN